MPRTKQPYLSKAFKPRLEHGGELRAGKRKLARPIDPKRPMHLVLRSSRARGKLSLLSKAKAIEGLIQKSAKKHGVQVQQYANAGNHLHLIVKARTRRDFQNFLRNLTGKIAQLMTQAKKGNAFGKFWDTLAYTRVVEWGRALRVAKDYVMLNELETTGLPTAYEKR